MLSLSNIISCLQDMNLLVIMLSEMFGDERECVLNVLYSVVHLTHSRI